ATLLSIPIHAYAKIPSHRGPSVERVRIHVQGLVYSPCGYDCFPEVGRGRGPGRRRRTEDLLDDPTARENHSLPHGRARHGVCEGRNRAPAQPPLCAAIGKYLVPAPADQ